MRFDDLSAWRGAMQLGGHGQWERKARWPSCAELDETVAPS